MAGTIWEKRAFQRRLKTFNISLAIFLTVHVCCFCCFGLKMDPSPSWSSCMAIGLYYQCICSEFGHGIKNEACISF